MMAQPGDLIERAILEICRDVCELPDRSSPEGEPDQVIVTLEELSDICRNVLTEALSAIPIPAPTAPYWFLEASNGSWLKNITTHATTRDPAEALSFPTQWAADNARQSLTGVSWMLFQPTEHMWLATDSGIDEALSAIPIPATGEVERLRAGLAWAANYEPELVAQILDRTDHTTKDDE